VTAAGITLFWLVVGAGPSVLVVPANQASRTTCEDLLEPLANASFRVKLAGERSEALKCPSRRGAARVACLGDAQAKAKVEAALVVTSALRGTQTAVTVAVVKRGGEQVHLETFQAPRARLAQQARVPLERVLAAVRASLAAPSPVAAAATRPERAPSAAEPPSPRQGQPARPALLEPPARAPTEPLVRAPAEAPPKRPSGAPEAPDEAQARGDAPVRSPEPPRVATMAPAPVLDRAAELVAPAPRPALKGTAVAGWVVLAAAVVAAGVAGTYAGLALSDRTRLGTVSLGVSDLTYTQAVQLRDRANLEFSVALGTGLGAAALGATAGVLWAL
jgi:hypothetical protein